MANRARTVIEQEILQIDSAISSLLTGERLKVLRVGSGDFARLYQEHDINLSELYKVRQALYEELATVTEEVKTFNFGGLVPMVGRK